MQRAGRRQTFSLISSTANQAAVEACHIYRTLVAQGWPALTRRAPSPGASFGPALQLAASPVAVASDSDYWKRRLVRRRSPGPEGLRAAEEFSVRIEHAGLGFYFPLGTNDERKAARLAIKIFRTVANEGWSAANHRYRREVTVAFHWVDDPLAWTYTTFHTRLTAAPDVEAAGRAQVAVVEPDAGIRLALADSLNGQPGFRCAATFGGAEEALRWRRTHKPAITLVNQALPNQTSGAVMEALQQAPASGLGLLYSVFDDSDELFKSTPGGAQGYLLKRTPHRRLLDPIAEPPQPLTREAMAERLREYFQRLSAALPVGPSGREMARLTVREHQLLALLSKGHSAKEIAAELGISVWTVHGHVKNIFEKLNVHTRTEAVVRFLQK
jgi:DNA-binding NarL/FixJ family response regulator